MVSFKLEDQRYPFVMPVIEWILGNTSIALYAYN
jgi:hypothetical protein